MRDLEKLTFHPTSERIVDILCKKTQNNNPDFFRTLLSYYLAKITATMRVKIQTKDRGEIPVNLYAINLATSGHGKGHSTNIIEEQLINIFRDIYFTDTLPLIEEDSLIKLANHRALIANEDPEVMLIAVKKECADLGNLAFSFDSATSPAVKQMRHKLLMIDTGAVNLEMDELGSNLVGNAEALSTFLELYDVGKIKQKLTKNTKESVRSAEIEGRTPTNLLLFGTPDKLFDGAQVEAELVSFIETGYGRRCFFGYTKDSKAPTTDTAKQVFAALTDSDTNQYLIGMSVKFGKLASITNHGKTITVSEDVSIEIIEYKLDCEAKAYNMKAHQGMAKAELSHRYFKALKLAGVYAFIDGHSEITSDNFWHAVRMAEESGIAFEAIVNRDRPYVKLAKYLGDAGVEVTHSELTEDLPFYKGTASAKQEMIQMAAAWGYKNNIIIKRTMVNGIEFLKGEVLKKSDMGKVILSYSMDIADGYMNQQVPFDKLHRLTQMDYHHWVNHHSSNGHRDEDHMVPGFDLVVIDVDGTATIQEVQALLSDFKYHIYTTKRHTDDAHRFRLILPMNYRLELNKSEYVQFMKNVNEWIPFEVDEQTCQRSRKWLTHKGLHTYNEGKLIDARLFIPKTAKSDDYKKFIVTYQSMTNMERWFITGSVNGNRNNQMARYALMLVDLGYDSEYIRARVGEMNDKLKDRLTNKEIDSTILVSVGRKIAKLASA